ncbi:MAG: hypothetical protein LBR10_08705 [Prevotellaceae bacterium]|nr:hypothetical protein [Prevotellaceae bacterium]
MRLKETQYIELKEFWRDEYLTTIAALYGTQGYTWRIHGVSRTNYSFLIDV